MRKREEERKKKIDIQSDRQTSKQTDRIHKTEKERKRKRDIDGDKKGRDRGGYM